MLTCCARFCRSRGDTLRKHHCRHSCSPLAIQSGQGSHVKASTQCLKMCILSSLAKLFLILPSLPASGDGWVCHPLKWFLSTPSLVTRPLDSSTTGEPCHSNHFYHACLLRTNCACRRNLNFKICCLLCI